MTKPSDTYRLMDDYMESPIVWRLIVRFAEHLRAAIAAATGATKC